MKIHKMFILTRRIIAYHISDSLIHILVLFLIITLCLQYFSGYKARAEFNIVTPNYVISAESFEALDSDAIERMGQIENLYYGEIYYDITLPNPHPLRGIPYTFRRLIHDSPYYITGDVHVDDLSESEIIAPQSYMNENSLEIGDSVDLFGNTFTIVGTANDLFEFYFIISDEGAKKIGANVVVLNLSSEAGLSEDQLRVFAEDAEAAYGDTFILPDYVAEIEGYVLKNIPEALLFFGIGSISLIYLYQYILSTRKKLYAILLITGVSNRKVISMIVFELTIVYTICYILSFAAIQIIAHTLSSIPLNPMECFIFYIGFYAVYLAVALLFCRRYFRQSAISFYTERGIGI